MMIKDRSKYIKACYDKCTSHYEINEVYKNIYDANIGNYRNKLETIRMEKRNEI